MLDDRPNVFRPAIDAHTHLLPERLLRAIRRSLSAETGWEFPTPTARTDIEAVLRSAGVEAAVALPYAHEAGLARELNSWLLERAASSDLLIPFATVHPDDEAGATIAREAFEAGACGLKIHCPVQECRPADPRLEPALEVAVDYGRPVTYHGGTAPMFEDSPYVGAAPFRDLLESYPKLRVCCAHMGTYEVDRFLEFAREYDTAYLDTTFAMSTAAPETMGFEPSSIPDATLIELSDSIMYGSDFPNIPYPYREERAHLLERELPQEVARDVFYRTALEYLDLDDDLESNSTG
ncbi:amidohydrolase family protein [Natronolimnohabitans innermongolicus]|uniref:Amidohydrolase 2 n=1 Tax=Natronolimnohabitans innermongolicus JCM 12255 TaxID=1227499 RepID=L9WZZ1_9EURY|nr:amidohydrolase family protein [Natronolimnohabitans innermongolicus]ELY55010.1 amidohydrolase 2 [Natronolimnohabitans innermongolicus JCM 12255]